MRKIFIFIGSIFLVFMLSGYAATIHIPSDYATIQAGINAATDGDTILAADGIYREHIDFSGKAIVVTSENGAEATIIEKVYNNRAIVNFSSGESDNSVVSGFTVRNSYDRAAIVCDGSSPVITNCIIEDNYNIIYSPSSYGGGIFFTNNAAPRITKNIIRDNYAMHAAGIGGSYCDEDHQALIDSNLIYDNETHNNGAGFCAFECSFIFRYNLVYNNHAGFGGGGLRIDALGGIVENNTICNNTATAIAGGIFTDGGFEVDTYIRNNIIYGNSLYGFTVYNGSNFHLRYNCFYGNDSGPFSNIEPEEGNIYDDPLFWDEANNDYRLTIDSPCINSGDPVTPLDPDGTIADMGALYYLWNIGYGSIAGLVTNEMGNPIEAVIVSVVNSEIDTVTDANGEYSLDSLVAPDQYDVFFSHPDYRDTLLTDVTVYADEITELDLVMFPPPQPGMLVGTVSNDQSMPLENIIVRIEPISKADTTDIDGAYIFTALDPGSYDVAFYGDNYLDTIVTDIIIISEQTTVLDVIMRTPPPDNDVGVLTILNPPDTMINELSYPLTAIVRNYGTNSQTFEIIFKACVGGSPTPFDSCQTAITDMPGLSVDTVTFSHLFTSYLDTLYNFYCYTSLTGDENNSNDTALAVSRGITEAGLVYLGGQDTPGMACNVQLGVNKAYVTDWQSGLQIYDVTNPASPILMGSCDTPGFARDIAIRGDYAYVADGANGIQIINIDDPANPFIVTDYIAYDRANCVTIRDNYLYIGYGQESWYGMQIVDISTPTHPQLIGNFAASDVVYRISLFNDCAYLAANSAIYILNIDNPAAPELIAEYPLPEHVYDVAVNNCYAYIADGENGLKILDVANPSTPVFLSEYTDLGDILDVHISNGFAFVADFENGLQVIDITNPNEPSFAAVFETSGDPRRIAMDYRYLYLADSDSLLVFQFIGNQHGSIDGEIANQLGYSIDSVLVTVVDSYARTYSNQYGFYAMDGIPEGIYDITFSHPDYRDTTVAGVEIVAHESAYLFMWMQATVDIGETGALPTEYTLMQNYPNPFNARTSIEFALPHKSFVQLMVYDIQGRLVAMLANDTRDAGYHKVNWATDGLTSGIYFYKLQAGDFTQTKKMVLLK